MGLIVSRQKAYNLTVTRRKRVIFYPQKVQGTSNLSISADLPRTTVPRKISKLENQFPCSQKHTLQTGITRPYNLLVSQNVLKFYSTEKGQDTIF